jgi:hypothetical protein
MKVGDTVKIKENLIADKAYGGESFVYRMEEYRGKQARITDVGRPFYKLDIDDGRWNWTVDMLEPISKKYVVTVSGNTVTVKDDKGNTGIAKCSPEDEFNLSTGISIAISRLKWKPSLGERYFTICLADKNPIIWDDDSIDNIFYERGLVFKTKEEAEEATKIMLDSISR